VIYFFVGLWEQILGEVLMREYSRVHTPLWSTRTDLEENFTYDASASLTPEQMALRMAELVQSGKYTGGTVYLEEKGRGEVVFEGIQDPAKGVDQKRPETRRVQGILTKERRRARSVG
jgi:hypothetical protein